MVSAGVRQEQIPPPRGGGSNTFQVPRIKKARSALILGTCYLALGTSSALSAGLLSRFIIAMKFSRIDVRKIHVETRELPEADIRTPSSAPHGAEVRSSKFSSFKRARSALALVTWYLILVTSARRRTSPAPSSDCSDWLAQVCVHRRGAGL